MNKQEHLTPSIHTPKYSSQKAQGNAEHFIGNVNCAVCVIYSRTGFNDDRRRLAGAVAHVAMV